jgi:hypothetical protein|tara:strand:- start:604 stop:1821 length:1218 start_codon:yes stop_codon:yes gene_type:complete
MITNTGKDILAKYLIGNVPSYASYLAFGCGQAPLGTSGVFNTSEYETKQALNFEMFRAPIVSKGYVTQNVLDSDGDVTLDGNGNPVQYTEVVFTSELPTAERYEITEIGLYSAGTNPVASSNQSASIYTFSNSENWEYHTESAATDIPTHPQDLYKLADGTTPSGGLETSINVVEKVFQANADDVVLDNATRTGRNERPRFLNSAIFMRGDASSVYGSGSGIYVDSDPESGSYDPNHIHINGPVVNLDKYSSKDELRMAFSIVNKNADSSSPTDVKIIVEFSTPEGGASPQSAKFKAHLTAVDNDFTNNRYFVVTKKLEELDKTAEFSWQGAAVVKVYASAISGGAPSSDYYIALDAMRIENLNSISPVYGLTGYTVTKTDTGLPILKSPNTANLVEFRFAMDVQ